MNLGSLYAREHRHDKFAKFVNFQCFRWSECLFESQVGVLASHDYCVISTSLLSVA